MGAYPVQGAFSRVAASRKYADGGFVEPTQPGYTPLTDEQKQAKIAQFKAQVAAHPEWMTAEGAFKPPTAGVNYTLEGRRPEDVISNALNPYQRPETDGSGYFNSPEFTDLAFTNEGDLTPGWRQGPDNGGGGLAGVGRAIGNTATGIAHNPALMAALTAGIASAAAPAASAGATAGGTATGGSAGIGSGTVLGGGTASVSPTFLQTVMSSPYAQPLMNAGKTLLSGGNIKDAALSGVGSYAGNAIGSEVSSLTDSPFAGNISNTLTQAALKGNLSNAALDQLATQYANGQLTDLTGLPPQVATMVTNLAKGKKISPIGALTSVANAVGSKNMKSTAVGND